MPFQIFMYGTFESGEFLKWILSNSHLSSGKQYSIEVKNVFLETERLSAGLSSNLPKVS